MDDIFSVKNKKLRSAILYKVGDTVIIHPDIRTTQKGKTIVPPMTGYAGRTATITEITALRDGYKIDLDHGCWVWQDFMFLDKTETINEQEVWGML